MTSDRAPDLRISPSVKYRDDFEKFLSHPVKIQHIHWTSTTSDFKLTDDLVSLYFTSCPASFAKKLASFYYFKATLRITVTVQGAPYAAGKALLVATPQPHVLGEVGVTYAQIDNDSNIHVNAWVLPHIELDPSRTETYTLDLPVCTPNGWYSFVSAVSHGSYAVNFLNFNPIFSGTATSPDLSVCVYASLVDPVFEGLTTLTSSGAFIDEKKEGGTLSATVKKIALSSSQIAPFTGSFGPAVTLFSNVAGVAGDVLAWFGFSKPPIVENQLMVLTRTCDNYSQSDGKSAAIVLGKSQTQGVSISPAFIGGSMDDMAFSKICAKRGYVYTCYLSPAFPAESALITTVPVAPDLCSNSLPYYFPTPLAGIAIAHNYWCGDMIIEFEIVASVFHRGTIMFAWDPMATSTTPPSFSDALTVLNNTTVNISGNTKVSLNIPWKQPMPWSRVFGLKNIAGNGIDANGMIYIYVVNPLTSNGSTSNVPINIFTRSDNIRFAVPSNGLVQNTRYKTVLTSSGEFTPVSFGPATNLSLVDKQAFGDSPNTVKDLASRMSNYWTLPTSPTTQNEQGFYALPLPQYKIDVSTPPPGNQVTHTTFFSYFAPAFLGYRGSSRMSWDTIQSGLSSTPAAFRSKVSYAPVGMNTGPFYYASEVGSAAWNSSSTNYAWTQPNLAISSRSDVIVPFITPIDFIPMRYFYSSFMSQCAYIVASNAAGSQSTSLEFGAGDDVVFGWFLGFPTMSFTA